MVTFLHLVLFQFSTFFSFLSNLFFYNSAWVVLAANGANGEAPNLPDSAWLQGAELKSESLMMTVWSFSTLRPLFSSILYWLAQCMQNGFQTVESLGNVKLKNLSHILLLSATYLNHWALDSCCSGWISRPDIIYQKSWMQTFYQYIL